MNFPALRASILCATLLAAGCSSSTTAGSTSAAPDPTSTGAATAPAEATAAQAANPPAATATAQAAPAATASAAPQPASTADANAQAARDDIAAGRLSQHPFKYELVKLVTPSVCKKFPAGWTGDGVIEIKDGKVVSFQAGDASSMTKFPDLEGKAAPAVPAELEPLFKKAVELSVAC